MADFCTYCGYKRKPKEKFCANCGKPFKAPYEEKTKDRVPTAPYEEMIKNRVPIIIEQLHARTNDFFRNRLPKPEKIEGIPEIKMPRTFNVNPVEARKIPGFLELISLQQAGFNPQSMEPDSHIPVFKKLKDGFSNLDIESKSLEAYLLAFANGIIFSGTNQVKEENHEVLIDFEKLSQKLKSNFILGEIITLLVSFMSYKEFISNKSIELVLTIAENVIKGASSTVTTAQLVMFIFELQIHPYYQNIGLENRFAQFRELISDSKLDEIRSSAIVLSKLSRKGDAQYFAQFIPMIFDMCRIYASFAPIQQNVHMLDELVLRSLGILEQICKKFRRKKELREIEKTKQLFKKQ
ncbi:MAG: zinc ribbon domain-containing protein [Candidatus Hodarchaeota archaeon]